MMNPVTAQRFEALELANETRSRRAQLKRDLHAGQVDFADLLADPPDWLLSARVWNLALAIPKAGRYRLSAAFKAAGITSPQAKTFQNITPDQRRRLLASLRAWPCLRPRIRQAA